MPNRAVNLLRRFSVVDSNLKKLHPSHREPVLVSSPCCHLTHEKRYSILTRSSTLTQTFLTPALKRSLSDSTIDMSEAQTSQNKTEKHKHTNRLINEKSPYLLQHAHNPVDWYPWCEEAFNKAKTEKKLIFLSVGYSTCHWCHVMEHESFENEDVAKIMNEHYINIKVDREERPDVDRVYMLFITATTGHGGWPMSVFLTPDLLPVTGGTYFPPENKYGRPGFKTILLSLAQKWALNKEQFNETANNIIDALKKVSIVNADEDVHFPNESAWNKAIQRFKYAYEPEYGGFGSAPKFPQAPIFNFFFHFYARNRNQKENKEALEMCLYTLKKMALGGIHDHVSSGFARYSVDNKWHVPHFEKMLYDQAQLAVTYTDAYLASKDEFYADVVKDIIKYVNRDLRHSEGGYFSAEDADSYPSNESKKKREGAFCVWDHDEIVSLFEGKPESYLDIFCDYFGVEPNGNISSESDPHGELTNKNVLIIYGSKEETAKKFKLSLDELEVILKECIDILYNKRLTRPRPHLDTKILCSWNGLMISGLARAGQGLSEKTFVEDAVKCATFIKKYLYDESKQTLIHSVYQSEDGSIVQTNTPIKGFMDDYAFLIRGLLDLYEASLDTLWLTWAKELQIKQNELFWDTEHGGYFTSSIEDPNVLLRLKEDQDGAEPSGNSVSCHNLLRLAAYSDKSAAGPADVQEREKARLILRTFSERLIETPNALPEMMSALMFYTDSPTQVLIAGGSSDPRTLELVRAVRSRLLPGRVLAVADPADPTSVGMSDILLSRIRAVGDQPTAYVCRRYSCSLPVTDVDQLGNLLDENH